MIQKKNVFMHAVLDGIGRGFLLYILGEYVTSQHIQYVYAHHLITSAVCAFISISLTSLLSRKVHKLAMFYCIGQAFFALSAMLIFVNYMTIGVHILPMRELGNADGLLIMLSTGAYLLISEPIRLVILFALHIHRKINNSTN